MGQRFSRRRRLSEGYGEGTDITRRSGRRRAQPHMDTKDVSGPSGTIRTDRLTESAESSKPYRKTHKVRLPIEDTASNKGEGSTGM